MSTKRLRTAELASAAGVTPSAVRYYERRGLLPDPGRTKNGYRAYPRDTIKVILYIRRAQDLGFTLREIKQLLDLREQSSACVDVCQMAEKKAAELAEQAKIALEASQMLARLVDQRSARARATSSCPVSRYLEGAE